MQKNRGFTLVEVIVAIALIGIIAIGIIPAFAAQYRMTVETKNITIASFDAQGEIERAIHETRGHLIDGTENGDSEFTLFGRTVTLYRLSSTYPLNENKSFLVFLSEMLAKMEQQQLLVADDVSIEISGETVHLVADLKKSPKPTLIGHYGINTDPKWYANVYRWYVSEEGNPSPKFPDDYERIILPGVMPPNLSDLTYLANRYIVFTVTPVDIHGVRGNEVRSTNTVYILGPEWRSGIFAWVDKDNDINFDELTDVKVEKSPNWPLLLGFDAEDTFQNPANPDEILDPGNGALYVPMGIDRAASDRAGLIEVTGSERIEWIVDKNIHLAADIKVMNSTDLHLRTRDGNIILYQYIELNPVTGDAVFENGVPKLIDFGPTLTVLSGGILFDTEGRGDVTLQKFTTLDSGDDLKLSPFGHVSLYGCRLLAGGSILIDSKTGSLYSGNRDIFIKDSQLTLKSSTGTGRTITIASRNELSIEGSTFTGNAASASRMELSAPDGIILDNATMHTIAVNLSNDTIMKSGGWDSNSTIVVPDGKTLTFEATDGTIENSGSLILGDTGRILFADSMEEDLQEPLKINLSRSGSTGVIISTDYGRNVGFADSSLGTSLGTGYRDLGTGDTNLEYAAYPVSGYGSPSLSISFDGDNALEIDASGIGPISAYYELQVRDKYTDNAVVGTILFRVRAAEGESPSIEVIGPAIPTFTVTFDKNGGNTEPSPSFLTVNDGESLGALPSPPSKDNYDFLSWNTQADGNGESINEGTIVTNNLTAYAKYSLVPIYTVAFDKNGGTGDAIPASMQAIRGTSLGSLPSPPTRPGYAFISWNTQADGGGASFTGSTIIRDNQRVYAQWAAYMTFAEINIGQFINIDGTSFQKISSDRVLARARVGSTMNWSSAVSTANSYKMSFTAYPWVIGSGLLTNTAIDALIGSYKGTILDINNEWWGADPSSSTKATTVNSSGDRRTRDKVNSYGCRPYLQLNTTNLVVDTGTGTSSSPYVLTTY